MAGDTEQLVLSISADVRQMQRALKKITQDTQSSTRQMEGHFDRLGKRANARIGGIGKNFVRGGLAGIAAGFSADAFIKLADANTKIINSLKVAGLEGEALTKVYDRLFESAQKNGTPISTLVELYSKLALSQKELGVSSEAIIKFTDNVGVALRVAGTDAQKASGALLQLGQALGGGVVRAEEFNAIIEGAPTILQAVAAGLEEAGGSVSKLRQLVIDGEVSSKAFFAAFEAGAPILEEKVAGAATTVEQAFTKVQNQLVKTIGEFDKSIGVSNNFATAMENLAIGIGNAGSALQQFLAIKQRYDTNMKAVDLGTFAGGLVAPPGGANTTPTTGRFPFTAPIAERFGPSAGSTTINPITMKDFPVSGDAVDKAAAKSAKTIADATAKAADKAAEEFSESLGRQAAVAVDAATGLLGQSENTAGGRGNINAFLKAGGVDLDAATTAWCAAFVNSALAQVGISGTGSNVATDFLNFGKAVNLRQGVQRGDVIVKPNGRSAGEEGGHVGFATGQIRATADGIKQIEILSGNASDKVQTDWVNVGDVVGRRATEGFALAADGLENLTAKTDQFTEAQEQLQQTMEEIGSAVSGALSGFISDLVAGEDATESLKRALGGLADQLLNIALSNILGGQGGAGGGIGGFLSQLLGGGVGANVLHTGGTVGAGVTSRRVSPTAFLGAPRYHSGGVAGEMPAILQRGERILPRGAKAGSMQVNIHNTASNRVEATATQSPGRPLEVVIREIVASDINNRGTALNKAVRFQANGSTATPPGALRKM